VPVQQDPGRAARHPDDYASLPMDTRDGVKVTMAAGGSQREGVEHGAIVRVVAEASSTPESPAAFFIERMCSGAWRESSGYQPTPIS